jgi:hypothetical protein
MDNEDMFDDEEYEEGFEPTPTSTPLLHGPQALLMLANADAVATTQSLKATIVEAAQAITQTIQSEATMHRCAVMEVVL